MASGCRRAAAESCRGHLPRVWAAALVSAAAGGAEARAEWETLASQSFSCPHVQLLPPHTCQCVQAPTGPCALGPAPGVLSVGTFRRGTNGLGSSPARLELKASRLFCVCDILVQRSLIHFGVLWD